MMSGKDAMCAITDLQSCYNCQLAEIGRIVEESVGRDRSAIKLITKIIPNWQHYARTGFGISNAYYSGEYDRLAGTGQGNRFSSNVCRDTLCLIIKCVETKDLGMNFKSNVVNETMPIAAVAHVDNNNLVSDGSARENAK